MTDTEVIKEFYEALNTNDIPRAMKTIDTDIERVEFEGSPSEGKFKGYEAFKKHITEARATWAEGKCDPKKIEPLNNKYIVHCHVRVKLKNQPNWLEGDVTDVYALKNQKITVMRTFATREAALQYLTNKS